MTIIQVLNSSGNLRSCEFEEQSSLFLSEYLICVLFKESLIAPILSDEYVYINFYILRYIWNSFQG